MRGDPGGGAGPDGGTFGIDGDAVGGAVPPDEGAVGGGDVVVEVLGGGGDDGVVLADWHDQHGGGEGGLMNTGWGVAGAWGPLAFGLMLGGPGGSWRVPLAFSLVLLLVGVAVSFRIRPHRRTPAPAAPQYDLSGGAEPRG